MVVAGLVTFTLPPGTNPRNRHYGSAFVEIPRGKNAKNTEGGNIRPCAAPTGARLAHFHTGRTGATEFASTM